MNIICWLKGHDWKFGYNHGIPLGSTEPYESIKKKFETGEYFEVHQCSRCKIYDALSDGLNPYTKDGFSE